MKRIIPLITALLLLILGHTVSATSIKVTTEYDYDTQRLMVSVVEGVCAGEEISILIAKYDEASADGHTALTESDFSQKVVYVRQHIYENRPIPVPLGNIKGGTYVVYVSTSDGKTPVSSVFTIDDTISVFKTYQSFEDQAYTISATMREVVYTDERANSGNTSLKAVGKPGDGWGSLRFNDLNLLPGKSYTIHFWASASGGVNVVSAELCHANSQEISGKSCSMPIGGWARYSFSVTVPESWTSSYLKIDVRGEEHIYLDDLVIYDGILSEEILEYKETEFHDICEGDDNFSVYVDPSAEVNGDGSFEKPFADILEARDYVRTINDHMTMDITVYLMGGTYEITDTIELTEEDSGPTVIV